jgi:hypothetical protein
MKNLSVVLLLVSCLAFNLACSGSPSARGSSTTTVVKPPAIKTDSGQVVNNPGKGWMLYVLPGAEHLITYGPGGLYNEVLNLGTLGYTRFNWKDVQSENDWENFDWSKIEAAKNAWKAVGKQFSFRIMAANSHGGAGELGRYITPKWVFENNPWGNSNYYIVDFGDDGFNGDPGEKVVPVWNDPGFFKAVDHLAKALAAKYGNDPDIAYIDIGTYGNWGEQHLYPLGGRELTRDELTAHLQLYVDAFKAVDASVWLAIDFGNERYQPIYDHAIAEWNMAFRRDGVLGPDSIGEEFIPTYGKTPGIAETYAQWDEYTIWNNIPGHPNNGLWTEKRFWESFYTSRPTYQSVQWDLGMNRMYDAKGPLMKRAANLLGFHFVLSQAAVPKEMKPDTDYWVETAWQNHGLAPIVEPAKLAFALLDNGNKVAALMEAGGSDVKSWMPGRTIYENAKIRVPEGVKGTYRLAVGLFGNEVSGNPRYNLAIKGRISEELRWYPLTRVTIVDTAEEMSEPAVRQPATFDRNLAATPVWHNRPTDPPDYKHHEMKHAAAVKGTPPSLNAANMAPIWNTAPKLELNMERLKWFNLPKLPPTYATALGRVLWDDQNLYVRVEVKDATPYYYSGNVRDYHWSMDDIEVYLDEDNSRSSNIVVQAGGQGTYKDTNAFKLGANANGLLRVEAKPMGYTKQIDVNSAKVSGGYVIEMKIPFVKPVKAGQVVGFDFQVNDQTGVFSGPDSWKSIIVVGWSDYTNMGRPDVFAEMTLMPEGLTGWFGGDVEDGCVKNYMYLPNNFYPKAPTGGVIKNLGAGADATASSGVRVVRDASVNNIPYIRFGAADRLTIGETLGSGTKTVLAVQKADNALQWSVVSGATAAFADGASPVIGGTLTGGIAEMLVFNGTLPQRDIENLTEYLTNKYLVDPRARDPRVFYNPGFETGDLNRWEAYKSPGNVQVVTTEKHSGNYSALVTGRGSGGASVRKNITDYLKHYGPGRYDFGVWAKAASGSQTGTVLVGITDGKTTQQYKTSGASVDRTAWTEIKATEIVLWTGELREAFICYDSGSDTGDVYLDDFFFTKNNAPIADFLNPGFEMGLFGWQTWGGATIAVVDKSATAPHGGDYCLKVSGRGYNWDSTAQEVTAYLNAKGPGVYDVGCFAKMERGKAAASVTIAIQDASSPNPDNWSIAKYIPVGYNTSISTNWTSVSAKVTISWTGGPLQKAMLYFETTDGTTGNFFLDDFKLNKQ